MPVSLEIDLSAFLSRHRRDVPDLATLSQALHALCSLPGSRQAKADGGAGEAGDGAPGVTLASAALGRIRLLAIETDQTLDITGFAGASAYMISFVLSGRLRVVVQERSGVLLGQDGDGVVLERRRGVTTRLDARTRLLILEVPEAVLRIAAAQQIGNRLYGPLALPPVLPAASHAGTLLRHAAALCAGDLAVAGSALRKPALANRFERFVLRTLVAELEAPRPAKAAPRRASQAPALGVYSAA